MFINFVRAHKWAEVFGVALIILACMFALCVCAQAAPKRTDWDLIINNLQKNPNLSDAERHKLTQQIRLLQVAEKIDIVVEQLSLNKSNDPIEKVAMLMDIVDWTCATISNDISVHEQKRQYENFGDLYTFVLRSAFIDHRGDCTVFATAVDTLLQFTSIHSKKVFLRSKKGGGNHLAVLVDLMGNGEYTFVDAALEQSIRRNAATRPGCYFATGLGSETYGLVYTPIEVFDPSSPGGISPLPRIANQDIPRSLFEITTQVMASRD